MLDSEATRRLEQAVADVAQELRYAFQERNMSHMNFEVKAYGRPDGELNIEFKIGKYNFEAVSGDSVIDTVEEFFRREGWQSKHAGLRLTYQGEVER
jgi:hypothetical protein